MKKAIPLIFISTEGITIITGIFAN